MGLGASLPPLSADSVQLPSILLHSDQASSPLICGQSCQQVQQDTANAPDICFRFSKVKPLKTYIVKLGAQILTICKTTGPSPYSLAYSPHA